MDYCEGLQVTISCTNTDLPGLLIAWKALWRRKTIKIISDTILMGQPSLNLRPGICVLTPPLPGLIESSFLMGNAMYQFYRTNKSWDFFFAQGHLLTG